jgi:hypothetical protein
MKSLSKSPTISPTTSPRISPSGLLHAMKSLSKSPTISPTTSPRISPSGLLHATTINGNPKSVVIEHQEPRKLVVVSLQYGGCEDRQGRWALPFMTDLSTLRDAKTTPQLMRIIDFASERCEDSWWEVFIDLTGEFPACEDSRDSMVIVPTDEDLYEEIYEVELATTHHLQGIVVGYMTIKADV